MRIGCAALIALICLRTIGPAAGAVRDNSTVPGAIEVESSFEAIGVRWFIEGDDNQNGTVEVSYRESGTSDPWRLAQDLLRVEPGSYNGYGIDPGNLFAGSIFGLREDAPYAVRMQLHDPDGGAATDLRIIRTRAAPRDPPAPRIRYVIPGHGGGDGSPEDPYRGIASADAAAEPGDLFLLRAGVYTGGTVFSASGAETNPIVWRGEDRDSVILDGEGSVGRVVFIDASRYVHLENVTVRRPFQMAVSCTMTVGIVVRGCRIDVSQPTGADDMAGIWLRGPDQRDAVIEGNTIQGPIRWEDGRLYDAYGVIVSGTGHVVRYNEIFGWWDGIEVGGDELNVTTLGCDVYRNEIHRCTDDGIETDGSRHNIRILDNRITNCLCGLSCQPVFGGPAYFIRNVVYNWQLKALKFHEWPTGMLVFNNTFVGADPRGWGDGEWRRAVVRNNIFIGGSHSGPTGDPIALVTTGVRADLDFNAWYQALPERFANFNATFYPTLDAFRTGTGMELNGRLVDLGIFVSATEPPLGSHLGQDGYPPAYEPGSQDLRLLPESAAVDAGAFLPNITDSFTGAAPDVGAYEYGNEIPVYGPNGIGSAAAQDPAPLRSGTISTRPNPASRGVAIGIGFPYPPGARIRIVDASGRLVRVLALQEAGARRGGTVQWDGRDHAGRPVAVGTYLCIVDRAGPPAEAKITIVR
jgi:hypothetical protein